MSDRYLKFSMLLAALVRTEYGANFNRKTQGYSLALGFVLRRHQYSFCYVAQKWVRAFGGVCMAAVSLNWPKMRYHYNVMIGRVLSYLSQR